jgi:hypothetical protein
MPTGKHEHIRTYYLKQLKKDISNNKLFGFVQVEIETPEDLNEKYSEMTPIFKNAGIIFEDIGNICKITKMRIKFYLIKVIN